MTERCPRCKGHPLLLHERDHNGPYQSCLVCGYHLEGAVVMTGLEADLDRSLRRPTQLGMRL